jgi:hypothetical protein
MLLLVAEPSSLPSAQERMTEHVIGLEGWLAAANLIIPSNWGEQIIAGEPYTRTIITSLLLRSGCHHLLPHGWPCGDQHGLQRPS